MQQGENPVFLFDNFFKVWFYHTLKFYAKKSSICLRKWRMS